MTLYPRSNARGGGTKLASPSITYDGGPKTGYELQFTLGAVMKKNNNKDNVIDMTDRTQNPDTIERFKHLKVRFDLERAKVGLSASLLSIVVLVTLANNNLMTKVNVEPQAQSRGIASVGTGTSDAEDSFVRNLAKKELSASAQIGHNPSAIEKLAFGYLEGHYAVRLENGKLSELEVSNAQAGKQISNMESFIESNRDVMPVAFDKSVKVQTEQLDGGTIETWQLINSVSRPVAHLQIHTDGDGRLLALHVSLQQVASK